MGRLSRKAKLSYKANSDTYYFYIRQNFDSITIKPPKSQFNPKNEKRPNPL